MLGFDFGTRIIGVAVGNRLSGARALTTVNTSTPNPTGNASTRSSREWRPAQLIVGLPLQLDGSEQAMARAARDFAAAIGKRYRPARDAWSTSG